MSEFVAAVGSSIHVRGPNLGIPKPQYLFYIALSELEINIELYKHTVLKLRIERRMPIFESERYVH